MEEQFSIADRVAFSIPISGSSLLRFMVKGKRAESSPSLILLGALVKGSSIKKEVESD